MTSTGAQQGSELPIDAIKEVRGRRMLAVIASVLVLVVVVNFFAARRNSRIESRKLADAAVTADVTRTQRSWRTVGDGMILTAKPVDPSDSATLRAIRRTMKNDRIRHLRGDYGPGVPADAVSDESVRASLEFGATNGLLNVRYSEVPDGGELHFVTSDSVMQSTLKEWSLGKR